MSVIVPLHVEDALAQSGERYGGQAFTFSPDGVTVAGHNDGRRPVVMQWLTQCELLVTNVELCALSKLTRPEVMRYCLELPVLLPAFAGLGFTGDEEEGKLFLTASLPRNAINADSVLLLAQRMSQAAGSLQGELWRDGELSEESIDNLLAIGAEQSAVAYRGDNSPVDWDERALSLLRAVMAGAGSDMPDMAALDDIELEAGGDGDALVISFLLDSGIGLLTASVDVQDAPAADDTAAWHRLLSMPNRDALIAHLSISVDPFLERVVVSAPCYLVSLDTETLAMQLNRLSHAAQNFSSLASPEPIPAFPLHQSV